MENLLFTLLTIPELRNILRQELESYFSSQSVRSQNQQVEEKHLTVSQAAEFLNLAVPTIYSLVNKGEIPVSKPSGKRLYFSKKELNEWIKAGRKKTILEIASEAEQVLIPKGKRG